MTSMKIFQLLRPPPTPLVHLGSKFLLCLDLRRPISSQSPPLQMITNHSKENVIQGWLLHVIRSFLQVGFRFQCQLIDLIWISFDFFSYNWSLTICFLWLYNLGCAVVQEYHEMSFIYDYSGRVASWLATCTRNPKVPGSSLAATYAQR